MNDPNTKYSHTAAASETPSAEPVLFFNYHEYLTKDYEPLDPVSGPIQKSIIVNHYLNTHVPAGSAERHTTRLVRIPRCYHTLAESDIVPQFSVYSPGSEPAAVTSGTQFEPIGRYDGTVFGATSMTPLVPRLIEHEQLRRIIDEINRLLYQIYSPYSWQNAVESLLDMVTGTLYSKVVFQFASPYAKRRTDDLEAYITSVNRTFSDIKIISPRRTGFTSLDIQIPKPS